MEKNNIILIAIIVLVVALIAVGAYIVSNDSSSVDPINITENATNATNTTNITKSTNTTKNDTTINATANMTNNTTHKVYNPQTDSYVTVIGEKYDKEVGRWYTYDKDGVRYYNTRL